MKSRITKSALFIGLLLVFGFSNFAHILSPALGPSAASAALKSQADQNSRTVLYALSKCMRTLIYSDFKPTITTAEMKSSITLLAHTTDSSTSNLTGEDYPVGYEVDSEDGNADCGKIHLDHLRVIGKDQVWFWKQFYTIKSGNLNTFNLWGTAQANKGTIPNASGKVNSVANQILKEAKATGPISKSEKERRLAVAFFQCNTEAADGTPNTETATYNGKKYSRIDGGPTLLSVGYDMESKDGKFECNTLLKWGDKKEMERALKENGAHAKAIAAKSGATDGIVGDESDAPGCEAQGLSLGWILCPVIEMLGDAVDTIFSAIIQPLLQTKPINITDPGEDKSNVFRVWSNFRIYGNVLLILALLVIVLGEAIGGGLIDAYTVKKVLPRIFVAALLVNLSIYIIALALDVTNIIGVGIETLIETPFRSADSFTLNFGGAASAEGFGIAAGGVILTGVWAAATGAGIMAFFQLFLFFVLLPTLITMIAILVTILIRTGLIIFLTIISPVAFALYCLPNTEQYFRRWWDLLFRTLLVFPIIAVVFAMGNVLSVVINFVGSGFLLEGVTQLMSFVALVIPLFLIPFSFRIAGGVIGQIHEAVNNVGQRLNKTLDGRREQAAHDWEGAKTQAQEKAYDSLNNRKFFGSRFAARTMSGYDIKARRSAYNAKQGKIMEDIKNSGDDSEVRALTVDKAWADAHGHEGVDWRNGENGREYRTAGGAWVSEAAVDQAYNRWGGNQSAYQFSMGYEMDKALTQEEQDRLVTHGGRLLGQDAAWGRSMTDGQKIGLWKGAAFAKQRTSKQWKHYSPGTGDNDGQLGMNGLALMREVDEKVGSGEMAGWSADTFTTLQQETMRAAETVRQYEAGEGVVTDQEAQAAQAQIQAHGTGQAALSDHDLAAAQETVRRHQTGEGTISEDQVLGARETLDRASRIVDNMSSGGQVLDEDGVPTGATAQGSQRGVVNLYGASAATNQAARDFADTVRGIPGRPARPATPATMAGPALPADPGTPGLPGAVGSNRPHSPTENLDRRDPERPN